MATSLSSAASFFILMAIPVGVERCNASRSVVTRALARFRTVFAPASSRIFETRRHWKIRAVTCESFSRVLMLLSPKYLSCGKNVECSIREGTRKTGRERKRDARLERSRHFSLPLCRGRGIDPPPETAGIRILNQVDTSNNNFRPSILKSMSGHRRCVVVSNGGAQSGEIPGVGDSHGAESVEATQTRSLILNEEFRFKITPPRS